VYPASNAEEEKLHKLLVGKAATDLVVPANECAITAGSTSFRSWCGRAYPHTIRRCAPSARESGVHGDRRWRASGRHGEASPACGALPSL